MDQFTSQLHHQMNGRLQQHAIEAESILHKAQNSMQTAESYLRQLKEFIIAYNFTHQEQEIDFFKQIKPMFLKEYIYYSRLYEIEVERPVGSKDMVKGYFQKVLDSINTFYGHNRSLYQYYRSARTDYDHKMFVRDAESGLFSPEYSQLDVDSRFSTVYSQKIAWIQAFEQLADYALSQMETSGQDTAPAGSSQAPKNNLVWTDSNAALIEVMYALHARGSINHGNADMKQIVKMLETIFNVRLGNFYQTIKSMRGRKKVRTPYLNMLIESAERRMDETDMDF